MTSCSAYVVPLFRDSVAVSLSSWPALIISSLCHSSFFASELPFHQPTSSWGRTQTRLPLAAFAQSSRHVMGASKFAMSTATLALFACMGVLAIPLTVLIVRRCIRARRIRATDMGPVREPSTVLVPCISAHTLNHSGSTLHDASSQRNISWSINTDPDSSTELYFINPPPRSTSLWDERLSYSRPDLPQGVKQSFDSQESVSLVADFETVHSVEPHNSASNHLSESMVLHQTIAEIPRSISEPEDHSVIRQSVDGGIRLAGGPLHSSEDEARRTLPPPYALYDS
ncbi:hypothetical protein OBBRIDRAFT_569970 [Obba rivulosa]|uniref:Uncharacterized protein n=1 Tax=Obba rivulosa TaxID=1052685 RepID=A0A8E2AYX4_9APHY|nr:hypothetical protein OBBRIDRAFT_569970 [Obba rivulosa]